MNWTIVLDETIWVNIDDMTLLFYWSKKILTPIEWESIGRLLPKLLSFTTELENMTLEWWELFDRDGPTHDSKHQWTIRVGIKHEEVELKK